MNPPRLEPALDSGLTTFAMELIPRITRAQAMDALSSMATVAGYKAVLLGARQHPANVSAVDDRRGHGAAGARAGAGRGRRRIAGDRDRATLGAVVEAYDVRAAAGEQVRSLGAKFLEVDLGGLKTEDAGGYAVELSEEAMKRGRDLIAEHAKTADVVITTAQVPGQARAAVDD